LSVQTQSPQTEATGSVFSVRGFPAVFAAATAGKLGNQISYVAIPLAAVVALNATAGEVGLLGVFSTIAFLVIGLPAGAWVDRLRKRHVMITADIMRGTLLAWVPIGWWLGILSMPQLYAVVTLTGVATVFSDVASQSYLPALVGRSQLVSANARLVSVDALSQIAGRSLGGFLVDLLTAPVAIVANAVGYLSSAFLLSLVRHKESRPESKGGARHLAADVAEGVRYVFGDSRLRAIAMSSAGTNLFSNVIVWMLPVVFARQLGLADWILGVYLAVGGLGMLLGSLTARRIGRTFGIGRSQWLLALVIGPFGLLMPMIGKGPWLFAAAFGWLLTTFRMGTGNVLQVSLRQHITPDRMLGRMNATLRVMMTGSVSIGAGIAGLVGQLFSARAALWVGAIGLAAVWIPIFFSPLRGLRELPPIEPEPEGRP
jgi:MFS family permease